MPDNNWYDRQANLTLKRLKPRIQLLLEEEKEDGETLLQRLEIHFPIVFRLLHTLYGDQYDFLYHLEQILISVTHMFIQRAPELKALDGQREKDPLWFRSELMVGGVCYTSLFAGSLEGVRGHIPYFKELGITYLHLMPLFKAPQEDSDGGYAVSDYRTVDPALGTMDELTQLARELRANGISLVLDFVFNHTSNEHTWALKALEGDEDYRQFYLMFDDRSLPDQYERNLREIFPEQAPGNFTYEPRLQKWIWTTFRRFQWDLNYRNPQVFNAMLQEMLFLANQGVEVLRLDAVAFIWKQMGTSCENLPQAHMIIKAFNALVRIAAPAMLFKSEAIVHPDNVASYISWQECPISYNPTLMALLWESLATREVTLLRHSMSKRFALPPDCSWVNYVRCHDDIGWTFADEDAAELWINGFNHRQFLNRFYSGQFEGSFARGVPFNYNPVTQDMRISGTAASLAGLEQAVERRNPVLIDHAIARLLLIHGVILSVGGIPLIYLGDEIAMLNDYSYQQVSGKAHDSRWVHRPTFDWNRAEQRTDQMALAGRIFQGLSHLIGIRQRTPAFSGNNTLFFDTGNPHILGYCCDSRILALVNFSERNQSVSAQAILPHSNGARSTLDLVSNKAIEVDAGISLEPYQFVWLKLG